MLIDPTDGFTTLFSEPVEYSWSLIERPPSSIAELQDASLLRPVLNVDIAGNYVAELRVYPKGASGWHHYSLETIRVHISTDNVHPVAEITAAGIVAVGEAFDLSGVDSSDLDGGGLTYAWRLTKRPHGCASVLSEMQGPVVSFTPDTRGKYAVELIVTDSHGVASPARVLHFNTKYGVKPTADNSVSGAAIDVDENLVFDSFASTDPQGFRLTNAWEILSKPDGGTSVLAERGDGRVGFSTDTLGDYLIGLQVTKERFRNRYRGYGRHYYSAYKADIDVAIVNVGGTKNIKPVAVVNHDVLTDIGTTVLLDGTQSYDADGDFLSHTWAFIHKPAGSAASLSDSSGIRPALIADVAGDYIVQLIVHDQSSASIPQTVLISTNRIRPIANAGLDINIGEQTAVMLDGGLSVGFGTSALQFSWSEVGLGKRSPITSATFDDTSLANATISLGTLRAPIHEVVFSEIVYENRSEWQYTGYGCEIDNTRCVFTTDLTDFDPDLTNWWTSASYLYSEGLVENAAGDLRHVWQIQNNSQILETFELSAGGEVISVTIPSGVSAYVSTPDIGWETAILTQGTTTIDTAWSTHYWFYYHAAVCSGPAATVVQLVVADDFGTSIPDTVYIGTGNIRPVGITGPDSEVSVGTPIDLSGILYGHDADGDTLSFEWALIGRPMGSTVLLNGDVSGLYDGDEVSFTPDSLGFYLVQITASDQDLLSKPIVLVFEATNQPPVADAGVDFDTFVGDTAILNGTASSDPDGDAISYVWHFASKPAGSSVTLSDMHVARPSFIPDVRGNYILELVVSDFLGTSLADQVTVTAPNRAPIAQIEGEAAGETGASTGFYGGNSSDPDNDTLSYVWSITQAPTGSTATLTVSASPSLIDFTPDVSGSYTISLTVSDGLLETTTTQAFAATAGNNPPVLGALEPVYTVEVGAHLAIELQASDADPDDALGFYALPLPLPAGMTLDATTGSVHFIPETGQEGTYTLTFGVSDQVLTDIVEVTINVLPADSSDTTIAGRVLDSADFANGIETPLAGIPVRLRKAALVTITDANGAFSFAGLNGGGDQINVEPTAAGGSGGYTSEIRRITITQNQDRVIDPPILLGRLDGGCVTVDPTLETVLVSASLGVTVTIPANSITDTAGDPYTGDICLGSLPQKFVQPAMPEHTNACQIYALDAPGAKFTAGMIISAPNVDALPGEADLDFWQLYDSIGRFLPSSTAKVDVAGDLVSTTSSVLSSGALFAFLPKPPSVAKSSDQPEGNQTLSVFEGDLAQTYTVPGYTSFNTSQSVSLAYHSTAADPNPIVASDVTIAENAGLPVTLDAVLNIGGLNVTESASWNPRLGADGAVPALLGEAVTLRQSTPLDATGLPTGRYDYEFIARAHYDCSTVSARLDNQVYIHNDTDSPLGTGWNIAGLQQLNINPDGDVTISTDGEIIPFDATPGLTEIDETLSFPIEWGYKIELFDMDANGYLDVIFTETDEARVRILYNFGNREFEMSEGQIFGVPHVNVDEITGIRYPDITDISVGNLSGSPLGTIIATSQLSVKANLLRFKDYDNLELLADVGNHSRVKGFMASAIADFDNNGDMDIVYAAKGGSFFGLRIFLDVVYFTGVTHVTQREYQNFFGDRGGMDNIKEIKVFDFNNDGYQDIITRTPSGITLFVNTKNRGFTRTPYKGEYYYGGEGTHLLGQFMSIGDYDGNGFTDIAYSSNTGITILYTKQGLAFDAVVEIPLPIGIDPVGKITTLDANGDGLEDIIYSKRGKVVLFSNNGTQPVLPGEIIDIGHPVSYGDVADIDGDGNADLIAVNRNTLDIDFFKADNNTLLAAKGEFSTLVPVPGGGWIRTYKDGTTVEFDAAGFQTATLDTQGNRTTYVYDAEGRLLTITDQAGLVTTFTYGSSGLVASITDPQGNVTTFSHNSEGNLTDISEPDSGTIQFAYDENNRLVSTANQRGNTTNYSYDGQGRLSGATFPDGSSILNKVGASLGLVDGLGGVPPEPLSYIAPEDRVTTLTDRKGNETTLTVNAFGAPVEIIDPLGRKTVMTRDGGNLITRLERPTDTDPSGIRIDEMAYDASGNLLQLQEAVGTSLARTTQYTYEDTFNKLLTQTDPDGFVTSYEYDANGEVTKITDALNGTRLFTYTAEGKTAARTDKNGNATTFSYTDDKNLASITYADGSVTQMNYDTRGNATMIAEATGTPLERQIHRTYDTKNRLTAMEITGADGTTIDGQTLYSYDANGNMATTTDETGLTTSFTYDTLDRVTAIDDPAEGTIRRTYNLAGEITQHIDGQGIIHTYTYDALSRMTSTLDPEGNLAAYTYDLSDNIQTVTDGRGNITTFAYDTLNRTTLRTNPLGQSIERAYDLRDNLTLLRREGSNEINFTDETATYDALNRRTKVITPDNTLNYAFDPNGNLTAANDTDSGVTFAYDNRNRLASTTTDGTLGPQPASTLSYTYDALDRRVGLADHLGGAYAYAYDVDNRLTALT
ncbi:MAG: PKD domain-containing protein, partial [Paracoccaceae bacterium]